MFSQQHNACALTAIVDIHSAFKLSCCKHRVHVLLVMHFESSSLRFMVMRRICLWRVQCGKGRRVCCTHKYHHVSVQHTRVHTMMFYKRQISVFRHLHEIFLGFIPHGPMDKASAYGAEDSRFDPWCGSPFLHAMRAIPMPLHCVQRSKAVFLHVSDVHHCLKLA